MKMTRITNGDLMVVTSKEELDQKLLDGFGLSKKKNRYWYIQKKDPTTGKVITEKVSDELKDYCEELYMMNKLKKKGIKVEPQETHSTVATKAEKQIAKAIQNKIVQHTIKHIDKRTKKLLEWGEWVDNHLTTIAVGDTWEEKAENVSKLLDDIFKAFLDYEEIASELQKLRAENQMLKDVLNTMKKKLNPLNQIKELILELSRTGNTKIVENLINKYLGILITVGVEKNG